MIILTIFTACAVVSVILALCSIGMMFRNAWVYKVRTRCLHLSKWTGRGHDPYDRLPSYQAMLWRFWIWDINKFL